MKITVSSTAKISLEEIIRFLKRNWTKREIDILKDDIKKFRQTLKDGIVKHQALVNFPKIKYTLIGKKQIKLFYEVKKNEIIIKLFWHCKQNPKKLSNLLKQS